MDLSTATSPRFVSYLRVSTVKQGAKGLGIGAQRDAVSAYVRERGGTSAAVLAEFVETESGKQNDRPELQAAIEHCKLAGARLVIAKLDRLSRNAAFLMGLRDAGVDFVAADMPEADSTMVGIMAVIAQREREMISQRTKAALAVKRAALKRESTAMTDAGEKPVLRLLDGTERPLRLGNPNGAAHLRGRGNVEAVAGIKAKADATAERFRKTVGSLRAEGIVSAQGLARSFNERGFKTPRGGRWTATGVLRLLTRLGEKAAA